MGARLWDSGRKGKGYSLEALTSDPVVVGVPKAELRGKVSMKELFGRPKLKKDGTPGSWWSCPRWRRCRAQNFSAS